MVKRTRLTEDPLESTTSCSRRFTRHHVSTPLVPTRAFGSISTRFDRKPCHSWSRYPLRRYHLRDELTRMYPHLQNPAVSSTGTSSGPLRTRVRLFGYRWLPVHLDFWHSWSHILVTAPEPGRSRSSNKPSGPIYTSASLAGSYYFRHS